MNKFIRQVAESDRPTDTQIQYSRTVHLQLGPLKHNHSEKIAKNF